MHLRKCAKAYLRHLLHYTVNEGQKNTLQVERGTYKMCTFLETSKEPISLYKACRYVASDSKIVPNYSEKYSLKIFRACK